MIKTIIDQLFADSPDETLYHYTSFRGLMGIVRSGVLWASDIRYMNDAAELRHTVDLVRKEVSLRIHEGHPHAAALNAFADWVSHRITNGHMQFAASFRANGNLLSQWRGYSVPGKGVSIGVAPHWLKSCVHRQGWRIGRCVYDPQLQQQLVGQVINQLTHWLQGQQCGEDAHLIRQQAWQQMLAEMETDLLMLATVLKHPSFQEEEEWRVVSPTITDFMQAAVKFREGTSMLVPYVELELREGTDQPLKLDHLYLGPTPNRMISMNSLAMFLASHGIQPARGVSYCQIPYRH